MRRERIELVERDLKIFELIKKMGWVRQDDIACYLGLNYEDSKVNHIIRNIGYRLQKHGYIVKKRFLVGYPSYWCFSKFGAGFYGGIAEPKFVLQNIKHDSLVTQLLIKMLHNNVPNIKTEFELKHEIVFDKNKRIKIPDLVFNNVAIEIEITQKNSTRLGSIIREYKFGKYDQVIYYTTLAIAKIMSEMTGGDDKFKFKIIDENNIIGSPEFINKKISSQVNLVDDRQKLKERLGI